MKKLLGLTASLLIIAGLVFVGPNANSINVEQQISSPDDADQFNEKTLKFTPLEQLFSPKNPITDPNPPDGRYDSDPTLTPMSPINPGTDPNPPGGGDRWDTNTDFAPLSPAGNTDPNPPHGRWDMGSGS